MGAGAAVINRQFWEEIRQALLLAVGAIERLLNITPTTKECREWARKGGSR